MLRTVFTGFAPNLRAKDMWRAFKFLFVPGFILKWQKGVNVAKVETWLKDYYQVKNAITMDSGRSALLVGLKSLGLQTGDEVIVQAFTCVVVVNAIKQAGAKPVYVDIDDSLNISTDDLRRKITSQTKAIIVQHTFGIPADIDSIIQICQVNNIKLIEDCAHAMGVEYKGKKVGTFGEFAILSFGSDKSVSCVRGGALITNDNILADKVKKMRDGLSEMGRKQIAQSLFHYISFFKGKMFYGFFIGKLILALAKKLRLSGRIIYDCEKRGERVKFYPTKMANCLADLLLLQLNDFNNFVAHRRKIAKIYEQNIVNIKLEKPHITEGSVPLRYNIITENPDKLMSNAKTQGFILGDWYRGVVAPIDIDMESAGYKIGMCPRADKVAAGSVNLPTNINTKEKDARRLVELLNKFE